MASWDDIITERDKEVAKNRASGPLGGAAEKLQPVSLTRIGLGVSNGALHCYLYENLKSLEGRSGTHHGKTPVCFF